MLTTLLVAACLVLFFLLLSSWGHAAALRRECEHSYMRLYVRCDELVRLRRSIVVGNGSAPYKAEPWVVERRLASNYAKEFLDRVEEEFSGVRITL